MHLVDIKVVKAMKVVISYELNDFVSIIAVANTTLLAHGQLNGHGQDLKILT